MAKIKLYKSFVTGTPTEGKDTVTVGIDTVDFIYTLFLLGGDDTANLGPNAEANYYIYTGDGNDTVAGGRGVFYDGMGNDTYAIKGNALFFAGSGNDTYNGGEAKDAFLGFDADTVSFNFAPDNTQIVNTESLTVDLNKSTAQSLGGFGKDKLLNIENLRGGDGNDKFTGNADKNEFYGNGGNDKLYGRAGDDTLYGDADNDKLYGSTGSDKLVAGEGVDLLQGGSGGDQFDLNELLKQRDTVSYTSVTDSKLYISQYWDFIRSFDKGGTATDDLISFKTIDTNKALAGDQAFVFLGSGKFTAGSAWQIRLKILETGVNDSTIIQIDTDSDIAAEMEIVVSGVTGLRAHDFEL
jgi:Ca2+-binding RTX toxin-like protein